METSKEAGEAQQGQGKPRDDAPAPRRHRLSSSSRGEKGEGQKRRDYEVSSFRRDYVVSSFHSLLFSLPLMPLSDTHSFKKELQ